MEILSVTCDNASPNDTMIDELADCLKSFPGATNRTRCFAPVLNLVAKSIIQQFDVSKAKTEVALDAAERELQELVAETELEEEEMAMDDDVDVDDIDDVDGLVDVRMEMSAAERDILAASVRPVKLVLAKVRLRDNRSSSWYTNSPG